MTDRIDTYAPLEVSSEGTGSLKQKFAALKKEVTPWSEVRAEKLAAWYEKMSAWERAFLEIVATQIKEDGEAVYQKQTVDWWAEHADARKILKEQIAPTLYKQWYVLSISSSYRSPQDQFLLFFGDKELKITGGVVVPPIPNFIPVEMIDESGKPKPWYETQYKVFLAAYIKRAEYVAPPGFSEHQTWRAFDFKLKTRANDSVTLLGDTYGDKRWHALTKKLLAKYQFSQPYKGEPRHWHYDGA